MTPIRPGSNAEIEPGMAPTTSKPRLDITFEPQTILGLTDLIGDGALPETYVRNGAIVQIVKVSGDVLADQPHALKLAVVEVTADGLRRLLARHADLYKLRKGKKDTTYEMPASPTSTILKAVLSETHWENVAPLLNVLGAPVIRPDGTILQEPGYDRATRLYYSPTRDIPKVPEAPDTADVSRAREFLLDRVLVDFPWADRASRANFVALLMTPMLRAYIGGLSPLGAISAVTPGSGKTLLSDIVGTLYGLTSRPWVSDDAELRKAITATLSTTSEPVIVFDNVGEFDQVEQPTLAKLLTSASWADRELGSSNQIGAPNDRLWLVTGNNIRFGGDIPSRCVLVALDPRMPNPDQRTDFTISDLSEWLEDAGNQSELLYHLLVLARAWIVAGAPKEEVAMRNFRRWARAMAGFTEFHGIPGFMANTKEMAGHDEEGAAWYAFLATWHAKFKDKPISASDLLKSAQKTWADFDDPWDGAFVTTKKGELPSAKGLGMMLSGKNGRFFGEYSLRRTVDDNTKTGLYYVTRHDAEEFVGTTGQWAEGDR